MFGKKDAEKRSLEDMFTPLDDTVARADDHVSDYVEENKDNLDEGINEKISDVKINPLDCFGMEETKTEKWLLKCVKFWYCVMSFVWFLFGALTFAPVIFVSNKVNVIFKDKKKSFLASIVIYVVCVTLFIIFV